MRPDNKAQFGYKCQRNQRPGKMKLLDLTLPSPAENLACDEALLDWSEAGAGDEVLRFWVSHEHFVVVGYANQVRAEVNLAACQKRGISVYRRCSGGGTVLQGPGCLNYSLILKITDDNPSRNISHANQFIMERNCQAVQSAIGNRSSAISVRGHTDLCLGDLKFSGNSQRRRKHFLLFHGTFLLDFDLPLMSEVLAMPSKQPQYRHNRSHDNFLTNLSLSAETIKRILKFTWNATEELKDPPWERIANLTNGKYSRTDWNAKF